MHSNIITDIRLASETGYEALEIVESKLLRFLDQGFSAGDLVPVFQRYGVRPVCINALKSIERIDVQERKRLISEAERLCAAAQAIQCPTIQLVPFTGLAGRAWSEVLKLTGQNVEEIADLGRRYGVRFQLEPIAWAPIHSLSQCLELIARVGRENVGIVIDFWHLWAGEKTVPDEVAQLDRSLVYGVHFCDGRPIPKDRDWTEEECRGYLPGEGDVPLKDWIDAVKTTGFDGVWSPELYSPKHWEWDLWAVARECRQLMVQYAE